VAPGSVQLYSEEVVHARSRAACENKIPHKNRGFLSATPFILKFDFLKEEVIWE
jgi:hypothetical protein